MFRLSLNECLSAVLIWVICSLTAPAQENNPHGSGFKLSCDLCHTTASWKVNISNMKFSHSKTAFPLTGQHTALNCRDCHTNLNFKGAGTTCLSCHADPHQNTLGSDCQKCHNTSAWKSLNMMQTHNQFRFPLTGVHNISECERCHTNAPNFIYSGARIECFSCHSDEYSATFDPIHSLLKMSVNCMDCHTLTSFGWRAENFKHVPLSFAGAHTALRCNECHNAANPGQSQECYSCHRYDFERTADPPHVRESFPHTCTVCHNTTSWQGAVFSHDQTSFPLTGAHKGVDCALCHTSGYAGTPGNCYACHRQAYDATVDPPHLKENYSKECTACHNTASWSGAQVNHDLTAFPLTGAHRSVDCKSCHIAGYAGTPKDCYGCHRKNYEAVTDPPHLSGNYPKECTVCHNTNSWSGAQVNHDQTAFPLTGAHKTVDCKSCHTSGYAGTPTACYDCHKSNYEAVADPPHVAGNYSKDCTICHNTNSWSGAQVNHDQTAFPLTGAHKTVDCKSCHIAGYAGTPKDCYGCHRKNYEAVTDPPHLSGNYPKECTVCHNTNSWSGAQVNHDQTAFPLTGAHKAVDCKSCHTTGYAGTPALCFSCHSQAYNSAKDHSAQGYPHACETCHNTSVWNQVSFSHDQTGFPLTGAHIATDCSACHKTGFPGTTRVCGNCHLEDYNASANPPHKSLGIANTCETCHTTNPGWAPAQFTVHDNYYVITGAHAAFKNDCARCHKGNYASTPNTCAGCHKADYDNTSNPPHAASGFPVTCTDCHSQNAWTPASFNHDAQYFPIYSGKHRGKWDKCSDCHTTASNYKVFSCINCHEHNKTETDNDHRGVNGYSYVSTECYRCHPTGSH